MAATSVGRNDSPMAPEDSTLSSRLGEVKINLDGTGVANYGTGISFLDYILDCNQSLWICQRVFLHMVIVVLRGRSEWRAGGRIIGDAAQYEE
ncbi:imidazoleglycerol-phosphate dehydratase 2, chloroplastic-like [Triticum dicoccoides]|uniref:imidazoleglycerol-phosphate dehydratase 2, chloroplastic-like n=1 Tax=Triticum dicoccoides TaxID=85692 RepID=UPI001890D758|nr:imidazoleglycerol-phosphate dehydratase 2, chloroplastic-like [Triticum dicoccoides]